MKLFQSRLNACRFTTTTTCTVPFARCVLSRRAMTTSTATKVTLPRTPLFEALSKQPQGKTAIIHSDSGKKFSYGSLLADIAATRSRVLAAVGGADGRDDLKEQRVALLVENGYEYVGADFPCSCLKAVKGERGAWSI